MSGALSGPRCDEEWVPGVSLPIWLQGGENWSCRGSFRWRSALEKERQRGDEKTEKWSKKVTLTIHAPKTTNTHVNQVGGEPTGDVVRKESVLDYVGTRGGRCGDAAIPMGREMQKGRIS